MNLSLEEKLQLAFDSSLTAEERAHRMEEMLSEEERQQREIETELKNLRDMQFKKSQELHDYRVNEKNIEAEIQVGRCHGNQNMQFKKSEVT